ncbi:hypothetical protein EV562_106383 [Streptomyces sp. BK208]|uniref:hypothetical protein n=1 Tax=Streptomyces sp. BK208 TaxID=2512150 RepID=UPI00105ECDD0|nr:hypothetical protein [Streptomyces sp. BK208]TDT37603.1 hypothetical protein EV562_106383 [Streptomyces sp. BK208]
MRVRNDEKKAVGGGRLGARRALPPRHTVAALAGLVLTAGLLAGCSSSDGDGGGDGGGRSAEAPAKGGAARKGPVYKGPALPGLARQAAWSLPVEGPMSIPVVLDLGDTLLFAKDSKGAYVSDETPDVESGPAHSLYSSDTPEDLVLEFRDVKTGAVRKELRVKADSVTLTTWHEGKPAVAVTTSAKTGSDGLTKARTSTTATLYDSAGGLLGKAELPEREAEEDSSDSEPSTGRSFIAEGHLVETSGDTIRLTPVDGGTARTVPCEGFQSGCGFVPSTATVLADGGDNLFAPLVTDGYYPGFDDTGLSPRISLYDVADGKKVWDSAKVTPPEGAWVRDDGKTGELSVLRVSDGKVLTAWDVNPLGRTGVLATYDLAGGPEAVSVFEGGEDPEFSPRGDLAAVFTDEAASVVQVADGKALWSQGEGEHALVPLWFSGTGSVLYGRTLETETVLAVDARTKKVLAKDVPDRLVPRFNASTGYGWVGAFNAGPGGGVNGFFVFPPAS